MLDLGLGFASGSCPAYVFDILYSISGPIEYQGPQFGKRDLI
jgi:hypothetical protein